MADTAGPECFLYLFIMGLPSSVSPAYHHILDRMNSKRMRDTSRRHDLRGSISAVIL